MPSDLKEWDERLPAPPEPAANYVAHTMSGYLVFTAGIIPMVDGKLQFTGRLGDSVTLDEGYQASRTAALLALSTLREALGSLSMVRKVLQLVVYVASVPDFTAQSKVADGASDLLVEIFGDAGRPARTSVGVPSLPLGAPVELSLVVESRDKPEHQKG